MSGVTITAVNVSIGESSTSGRRFRGRESHPTTRTTTHELSTAGSRIATTLSPNTAVEARIMYATIAGWS